MGTTTAKTVSAAVILAACASCHRRCKDAEVARGRPAPDVMEAQKGRPEHGLFIAWAESCMLHALDASTRSQ